MKHITKFTSWLLNGLTVCGLYLLSSEVFKLSVFAALLTPMIAVLWAA